ncbi:MAG: benzoyl-CoA reductase subunit A [Deltaproteobacteria bacterium]|nr:benzoyl-CoA reductase subunit A [Deltaproteobacteria bacterium]
MKVHIGIDLGSTTTKAVLLDEGARVVGRGITNSRSNYDVACQVSRNEAFMDARLQMFGTRLGKHLGEGESDAELLEAMRRHFRLQQFLHQLGELEQVCRSNAERNERVSAAVKADVGLVFDELFPEMVDLARKAHGKGSKVRSDFFRDLAGSTYMSLAEDFAKRHVAVDYELLLGVYDKSILQVESQVPAAFLESLIKAALAQSVAELELDSELGERLAKEVHEVMALSLTVVQTVGTGYGRARLPFPRECIRSEILCHGLGAHATFPGTRTVLDIGGQDTKAIQVDDKGIVTSFQMNDRCAAGCGRYLGYIADEMNLGLQDLGPLAMKGKRPVRINSTCTVFAGAELRDRLATGQRREDILAGLHRAIMLRAMSLLARSGGVFEEFTFTGGVAKNEAAVRALYDLVKENYGTAEINISPESIYTGALGAALFALRDSRGESAAPEEVETIGAGGVS